MSSHRIVSVDGGNAGTNAVTLTEKGKAKYFYEPSVRARVSGDSLGLGTSFEMDVDYVEWYGNRYITGDDVTRISRRALERHMGGLRYGDEFHQFLVANACLKLGAKSGEVIDLVLFAPPGFYSEKRHVIKERFLENEGRVVIQPHSKKVVEFQYGNVYVLPEGIGAAFAIMFDEKGPTESDLLKGEVLIIDSGAYTLDATLLSNGRFNPESLNTATWDNGGVDVHIRQPIQNMIRKYEDFSIATVDDIDLSIRTGFSTGNFDLTIAGQCIDLEKAVKRESLRFSEWIANNVIDSAYNQLRGIERVLIVGGGSSFITQHLMTFYGDKVVDITTDKRLKKIGAPQLNAAGGLFWRLAMQKTS